MSNIIAAHQPNFLPNLGFFYKMQQADNFVLITNIQFEKHEGWQQRNKIPGVNNDIWLTVPVLGSQNQRLKEVKINNQSNWFRKHKKTFQLNYAKSIESELMHEINEIYDSNSERLVDISIQFIKLIKNILNIKTELIIDEEVCGDKHELLINICKKYKGNIYLSGNGAKNYMTQKHFLELEKNRISHQFVGSDPTAKYPYSTLHYILIEGSKAVVQKLKTRKEPVIV